MSTTTTTVEAPTTAPTTTTPTTPATSSTASTPTVPATAAATVTATTAPPPARVVPATYTLQLPQGPQGAVLDQDDLQSITALAQKYQWTNEEAQAALEESHTQLLTQRGQLRDRLISHAEVGGAHLEAAQVAAFRVLDRFLPVTEAEGAEFRSFIEKTGYGNWTPLVVLLSRIGKAMGEDSPASRSATAAVELQPWEVFYGPDKRS